MLPGKMPILKIVPERRAGPTRSPRFGNRAGRPRVATLVRCSQETRIQAPCPPPLRRAREPCEQQVQDAGVAEMTQTILAPTSHSLPASATALLPPQAGASVWSRDGGGRRFPPVHWLQRTAPPAAGPPAKDAAPQWPPPRPPAPHGAPARPRRPPGGGLRCGPAPGPVPAAYPERCSPHTPPLAAPSGTSSAATRPQPFGPAWGARAAGPGGGGGPTARPGSRKAPARLRARGQPSAPGAGPEPAVPARPLALGRPPPRAAPRRPAAVRRSPRPLRGPGRSCRKQRRPCPPGEGRTHPAPPLRSEAAPLGERKPARRPELTGALKGAAALSCLLCNPDTRWHFDLHFQIGEWSRS